MKSIKFYINRRVTESPIWLTIYSDLMTNLMLFFLLLYGMTIMTEEMRKKIIDGLEAKFKPQMTERKVAQILQRVNEEEMITKVQHYVVSENLRKYATVEIDEHRIKIILRTPILFKSGEAGLMPEAREVMAEVASVLKVKELNELPFQ